MGTGTNVLTALRATPVTMARVGRDDASIAATFTEGPIAGTLDPTRISGEAWLHDRWVQVANRKQGTFWVRGTAIRP